MAAQVRAMSASFNFSINKNFVQKKKKKVRYLVTKLVVYIRNLTKPRVCDVAFFFACSEVL